MRKLVAVLVVGTLACGLLRGQAPAAPAFEVASVKPNRSGEAGGSLRQQPGGRVDAVNMPLRQLISFAYQVPPFRLAGGPAWIANDRFDIAAKLSVEPSVNINALAIALRGLLTERFKLQVHEEMRDQDIYALVLARPENGPSPALRRSTQECDPDRRNAGAAAPPGGGVRSSVVCGMRNTAGRIEVGGMPLSQFINVLAGQRQVGRVVVDRTELTGNWDFELTFSAALPGDAVPGTTPTTDPDAVSIFTALQEQLGLKLQSTRGPVNVVVIDAVEQPTPD
jgi:uncharacterized protein (TIGR03435 family)